MPNACPHSCLHTWLHTWLHTCLHARITCSIMRWLEPQVLLNRRHFRAVCAATWLARMRECAVCHVRASFVRVVVAAAAAAVLVVVVLVCLCARCSF